MGNIDYDKIKKHDINPQVKLLNQYSLFVFLGIAIMIRARQLMVDGVNRSMKSYIKVILLTLFIYNSIPIINILFPITSMITFLADLWIFNTAYSLIISIVYCFKYGSKFWLSLIMGLLYVPTMFIFYNSSAFIFVVLYSILSLVGCLIGYLLYYLRRYLKSKEQ